MIFLNFFVFFNNKQISICSVHFGKELKKACFFYWWFWFFFTFLGKLNFKAKGEELCLNANCHLNCCEYTNEFEARRESETAFAFIWSSDFIKLSKMTRAYRGSFFSYKTPFTKMSWEKLGEVKKNQEFFRKRRSLSPSSASI